MFTKTTIKIAARKSDLARLQAHRAGETLQQKFPELTVQYFFSTSLGDQNQNDPLWQMPEKGVFTEDLTKKLIAGECDMVVHSWKDLPTEERSETEIAATLSRADPRDVILFRKVGLEDVRRNKKIRVYSSSPRRILSVGEFLQWALPFHADIQFCNVRGNIATRVKKLMSGEADALVMAKAALDRLLESQEPEFAPTRQELRAALKNCLWMITPLAVNPGAPAQGALAIEIRRDRHDLKKILVEVNCEETFKNVQCEREILKSFGGGCHQKIGVTRISRHYGDIEFLRGETDDGRRIDSVRLLERGAHAEKKSRRTQVAAEKLFPLKPVENFWFKRRHKSVDAQKLSGRDLWVARFDAFPQGYQPETGQLIWASGLKTWRKLAERGVWVSGSQESLGEDEGAGIQNLIGRPLNFLKLSHSEADGLSEYELLATYELVDAPNSMDFKNKTHFFWLSFSSFKRALAQAPEIRAAQHACGPGHTYKLICQELGDANVEIFLSHSDWLKTYQE